MDRTIPGEFVDTSTILAPEILDLFRFFGSGGLGVWVGPRSQRVFREWDIKVKSIWLTPVPSMQLPTSYGSPGT
jgi:hypothetical protein